MKVELRFLLVCLCLLKQGQCISNYTMDTTADLVKLGWTGPKPDWVDYFNSTKDFRSKEDRYPDIPYDLVDKIPAGFGIWGLLHNDVGHGWAVDPMSFQITASWIHPTQNIHLRFFLHGDAFVEVVADNKIAEMVTVKNPCGSSCRPKFREKMIWFTNEAPTKNIIVRMNTTNISDVVLIDSISLDFEGDVEDDEDYYDECECEASTQSDLIDLGESSAFGDECLSTLDDQSDEDWTSPAEFYYESLAEATAGDFELEFNFTGIADKRGIWVFAGTKNSEPQLETKPAAFSYTNLETFYESVNITAISGGKGSISVFDPETAGFYTVREVSEGDDGWSTILIHFQPTSSVDIMVSMTDKQDFVVVDKIIAYGSGCDVTGTTEVTPPMCECTTLSITSTTTTKNTTPSTTTKGAETTTKSPATKTSTLSTSSEPSNTNTTSTKPSVEITTPDGASLLQPVVLMAIITFIVQLA